MTEKSVNGRERVKRCRRGNTFTTTAHLPEEVNLMLHTPN